LNQLFGHADSYADMLSLSPSTASVLHLNSPPWDLDRDISQRAGNQARVANGIYGGFMAALVLLSCSNPSNQIG
jgi:hypothetical protein